MSKKKSPKDQNPVQSSTFRSAAQGEPSDQIFRAVRGEFYQSIVEVLRAARSNAYRAVNFVMVEAYWNIGRMIVEEEQQGKERAEYGSYLLNDLATRLTREFGKGFNETNLRYIRQFYLTYPIRHAVRDEFGAGSDAESPRTNLGKLRHDSSQNLDSASDKPESHYRLLETLVI